MVSKARESRGETLCERVDDAIRSHKSSLMAWMGPEAAVGELVRRDQGLEEALDEIAHDVEEVAVWQSGRATTPLTDRVEAIRARKGTPLPWMGPQAAVGELLKWDEVLERALAELSREVEELAASRPDGAAPLADNLETIASHKHSLLSTTPSRTALSELVRRNLELEEGVLAVASEAQKLAGVRPA